MKFTMKRVLTIAAISAAVGSLATWRLLAQGGAPQGPTVRAAASAVKPAVPGKARPLPLSDVRVTGGPLKHAQDLNGDHGTGRADLGGHDLARRDEREQPE